MNENFYKELIAYNSTKYGQDKYNWEKLNEELAELLTLTTKKMTKNKNNQPKDSEIIDEIGDVIIRIHAIVELNDWGKKVGERILYKKEKLTNYILNGQFKGGI